MYEEDLLEKEELTESAAMVDASEGEEEGCLLNKEERPPISVGLVAW